MSPRQVAPEWVLTLEAYSAGVLEVQVVADSVSNANLSVSLNDLAELSFTLPEDSPMLDRMFEYLIGGVTGIIDGNAGTMPFVRLRRRGEAYKSGILTSLTTDDPATVFFGVVADIDLTLGEGANATVRAVDVIGSLEGVILTSKRYKNAQEMSILSDLISAASGQTRITAETVIPDGWDLSYTGSPAGSSRVPTRSLAFSGVSILEALKTLAEMNQGFDFYGFMGKIFVVSYDAQVTKKNDRSNRVLFGYGDEYGIAKDNSIANVVSGRAALLPPRNRIVTTNESGKISTKSDSGSISRFGQFGEAQSNLNRDSTREERETAKLRLKPRIAYSVVADPELSSEPFVDYFPGDKVRIDSRLGGSVYGGSFMVTKIEIEFDETLVDVAHGIEVEVL
jgi:hypothetical protein